MNAAEVFRTPVIAEQVLLLVSGKKEISREEIYRIVVSADEDKHAVACAIWHMKRRKQIVIEDGIIKYIGDAPEKKLIDRVWEALRQSPAVTVKELAQLTSAGKSTIYNALGQYQKEKILKVAFCSWEHTTAGLRKVNHYTLLKKDIRRPR